MNNVVNQKILKYQIKYDSEKDIQKKNMYAMKLQYYKSNQQSGGEIKDINTEKTNKLQNNCKLTNDNLKLLGQNIENIKKNTSNETPTSVR